VNHPGSQSPKPLERQSFQHTLRTTLAAATSLMVVQACGLEGAFWAVVTTVLVTQSSQGSEWAVSFQRLTGTLVGGITAAVLTVFFPAGFTLFVAGMLAMGLICTLLPMQTSAYRFAGIALAAVMLPDQTTPIRMVAVHRILEAAIGIVVGMGVTAMWREGTNPGADRGGTT